MREHQPRPHSSSRSWTEARMSSCCNQAVQHKACHPKTQVQNPHAGMLPKMMKCTCFKPRFEIGISTSATKTTQGHRGTRGTGQKRDRAREMKQARGGARREGERDRARETERERERKRGGRERDREEREREKLKERDPKLPIEEGGGPTSPLPPANATQPSRPQNIQKFELFLQFLSGSFVFPWACFDSGIPRPKTEKIFSRFARGFVKKARFSFPARRLDLAWPASHFANFPRMVRTKGVKGGRFQR